VGLLLVDQRVRVDVVDGDQELGVEGPLPQVERAGRVDDDLAPQLGPHPPRHGLDVVYGSDRLG